MNFPSAFVDSPFGGNWDSALIEEADNNQKKEVANIWLYQLITDADGLKLLDQYRRNKGIEYEVGSPKDKDTDIFVYYEKDDTHNKFGSVCLVKMNLSLCSYIEEDSSFRGVEWLAKGIIAINLKQKGKPGYIEINKEKLESAIRYELTKSSIGKIVGGFLSKKMSELFHSIAESFRDGKFEEKNWNPTFKDYDPIIADIEVINKIVRKWNAFKNNQNKDIQYAKEIADILSTDKRTELLAKALFTIINIWEEVITFIDRIVNSINEINITIQEINAFICGFINSILDLAAGMVDFVSLAIHLTDKIEKAVFDEMLENVIQDYTEHPEKVLEFITSKWEAFKKRYNKDKPSYEIAYQAGEDVIDLLAILDGIKILINFVKALPKKFENLVKWVERIVGKVEVKAKNIANFEYSDIAKTLQKLRFEYINKKAIDAAWLLLVKETALSTKRIKELATLRNSVVSLGNKNLATMKIKVFLKNGQINEFEYIAHAGRGKKLTNSVGAPEISPTKDFIDLSTNQTRWYDSENKMLIQMDKDLKGFDISNVIIEIESTFTPCTICRREILLRKKMYNAKVYIESSKFENSKGKTKKVKGNADFKLLLKQLK